MFEVSFCKKRFLLCANYSKTDRLIKRTVLENRDKLQTAMNMVTRIVHVEISFL